ncbi:MAG: hypothetical protein PHN86_05570 [Proteiniphilum sp.]|nr:hypothetical protein [Proteiniphilum sp.]
MDSIHPPISFCLCDKYIDIPVVRDLVKGTADRVPLLDYPVRERFNAVFYFFCRDQSDKSDDQESRENGRE